jgi:hypothetical protein
MANRIPCPKCGERFKPTARQMNGRRVTCPECGAVFTPRSIETDAEDDRPKGRRKGAAATQSRKTTKSAPMTSVRGKVPPAMIVAAAFGAFVVLLGVGLLIYFLTGKSGKAPSNDLLAHAPSDAVVLSGYDLDEIATNDAMRKSLEKRAPPDMVELDRAGLAIGDLSRVLIAKTVNNGNTCVVRFKKAPDHSKYLAAPAAGKSYGAFTSLTGNYRFGYFADASTLVLADKEPTIQALQEKGAKNKLTSDLQGMVNKVRGPIWRASGRIGGPNYDRLGPNDDGFTLRAGPASGTAAWLVPDGKAADVFIELEFENAKQANQAAATLKGLFLTQREVDDTGRLRNRDGVDPSDIADIRRGYDKADVSENGSRVTAKVRLPASEAVRAIGSIRK